MNFADHIQVCLNLSFTLIPVEFRSRRPLVRWDNNCSPSVEEPQRCFAKSKVNIGSRHPEELALTGYDFDDNTCLNSITARKLLAMKRGRGYYIFEPRRPVTSQCVSSAEINVPSSYSVTLPSVYQNAKDNCILRLALGEATL